jgi:hypothetical protein
MAKSKKVTAASATKKKASVKKNAPAQGARVKKAAVLSEATVPQPALETVQPAAKPAGRSRGWIWALLIVAIIALIGLEVTVALKNKMSYQGKVTSVLYFGERGENPDKIGKFWGASRIRVDNARKRVVMVDGMFNKLLYWETLKGEHLMDLDKDGPHKLDTQGHPTVKNFTPANGDLDGEGNMYVLDKNNSEITVYTPEYKLKTSWKCTPSDKMAVSKEGLVYVVDYRTMEIVQYSSTGQELKHLGKDLLNSPGHMAVDELGNLYVTDLGQKKVIGFSPDGKVLCSFSPRISPFTDQDIDARHGKIYLSMYDLKRLFVYSTQGKLLWDILLPYPGTIAVDDDGLLYLAGPGGIGIFRIEKQFQ